MSSIDSFRFDTDGKYGGDSANQLATMRGAQRGRAGGGALRRFHPPRGAEALDTSAKLKTVAASYTSTADLPDNGFARGLQTIAKLIAADLGTRIFHITIGGFDTHAGQARHAQHPAEDRLRRGAGVHARPRRARAAPTM